ncbi:hypothetical protein PCANC_23463, partial [Puccinia coronata f. sp. avenae]
LVTAQLAAQLAGQPACCSWAQGSQLSWQLSLQLIWLVSLNNELLKAQMAVQAACGAGNSPAGRSACILGCYQISWQPIPKAELEGY